MISLSISNGNNNNKNDDDEEAIDISRDLDGTPLDNIWIQNQIIVGKKKKEDDDTKLIGYSVPESEVIRGMMSNGCRIYLYWNKTSTLLPNSVFYKRVVMADLHHAQCKLQNAPHKLKRDVKSYQVETEFLSSDACQIGLRYHAGVHVPKVYAADLRPCTSSDPAEQLNSKFAMLLEDFSSQKGWTQQWLLDEESAKAALEALAKLHAYFWNGSNFWTQHHESTLLEGRVWENGGYMQPALQGYQQLEKVNMAWRTKRLPTFEKYLNPMNEFKDIDLDNIGERLQKIAKIVGQKAHPFSSNNKNKKEFVRYRTLIHGDPKQANLFFRTTKNSIEVGLIDFQWCGFGLCGTDVAHFIAAAVQPTCISMDGTKEETLLLQHYYSHLSHELVKQGVASSLQQVQESIFPRTTFQTHYETALLDICRMVFAYAWDRWKEETQPTTASFNRNAYNKSLPNAIWLIVRCCKFLSTMEDGDTTTPTN